MDGWDDLLHDVLVVDLTDEEIGEQLKLLADDELDAYIDWDEGER